MGIPFIIGASQQKKKRILGFETYVAPDDFDRTVQDIDIYDVFERYYRINNTAKWIFRITDTTTTSTLTGGTSYRYGYESGGITYTVDIVSPTIRTAYSAGSRNDIPVTNVSGFPTSGYIQIGSSTKYFQYDSLDTTAGANRFVWSGAAQAVDAAYVGYNVNYRINWTGTKRWIIVNHTTMTPMICTGTITGTDWLYCGNLISRVSYPYVKYIHIDKLSNITSYMNGGLNGTHTGHLYISGSASYINQSEYRGVTTITAVTFNEGLTEIQIRAFEGCSGIIGQVILPNSLIKVGGFNGCTKITEVVLNEGLTTIYDNAFSGNTGMNVALSFPSTLITIGNNAYSNCNKIPGILSFPNSLTTIGENAFYSCTTLSVATLTITSGITSIGEGAFAYDKFNAFDVSANSGYHVHDNTLYQESTHTAIHGLIAYSGVFASGTIENDTIIIGNYCFASNTLRTGGIEIPNTVTRIGIYAFNLASINALTFESISTLITIDAYAFASCFLINGIIYFPDSLKTIGDRSFFNCSSIDGLTFGTSSANSQLLTLGGRCFQGCSQLAGSIILSDCITSIASHCFYGPAPLLTGNLYLGVSLKSIGEQAFRDAPFTGTLTIPDTLTTIISNYNNSIFSGNQFTDITMGTNAKFNITDKVLYWLGTVGQIDAMATAGGYSGTLTLRNDTTRILNGAFQSAAGRSGNLTIPSTVTAIQQGAPQWGVGAFYYCTGFTGSLIINTTNVTITTLAFEGSTNFTALVFASGVNSGIYDWSFCAGWSTASLHQSLIDCASGTSGTHKAFKVGTTKKNEWMTDYPDDAAYAVAKYIDIT